MSYISSMVSLLSYLSCHHLTLPCNNSTCGYNTEARQHARTKQKTASQSSASGCIAPYDFTGCLAHADITYIEATTQVCRTVGHLEHNEQCRGSFLRRIPAVPLHPHVIEVALKQLSE